MADWARSGSAMRRGIDRRHRADAGVPPTPPKPSTARSTPPTNGAPSPWSRNLHPAGFVELMPKTIANATVDRLLHHAHVVITAGESIRLTQATRGKEVRPLTN